MRKGGLSFVLYLLYTLLGGAMCIYNYIAIQRFNEQGGGWEGLGLALLLVLSVIVFGVGVIGMILKGIHIGTGWGFFGFLCVVFDLACIAVLVSQVFMNDSVDVVEAWPIIAITMLPVASAISNLVSIRR